MSFKRISPSEAKNIMSNNIGILVDIRDTESFNKSHDNRAINLTQACLTDFIVKTNKDTPLLILCYHGNSSQIVAEFLSNNGFRDVYSIDGGYEMW